MVLGRSEEGGGTKRRRSRSLELRTGDASPKLEDLAPFRATISDEPSPPLSARRFEHKKSKQRAPAVGSRIEEQEEVPPRKAIPSIIVSYWEAPVDPVAHQPPSPQVSSSPSPPLPPSPRVYPRGRTASPRAEGTDEDESPRRGRSPEPPSGRRMSRSPISFIRGRSPSSSGANPPSVEPPLQDGPLKGRSRSPFPKLPASATFGDPALAPVSASLPEHFHKSLSTPTCKSGKVDPASRRLTSNTRSLTFGFLNTIGTPTEGDDNLDAV